MDSFDILVALKKYGIKSDKDDPLWWPNSGTFEVVLSSILTQNTKWQNVQKALANLRDKDLIDLDKIDNLESKVLATLIKPSGFYNTKTKYIKSLVKNIKQNFTNFDNFKEEVTREWLLEQKGISFESADSILCYACLREEMVVDKYSHKLLISFGIEMEEYEDVKQFFAQGITDNLSRVYELYEKELPLNEIFARFHGKIVTYCSTHNVKKQIDIQDLKSFI